MGLILDTCALLSLSGLAGKSLSVAATGEIRDTAMVYLPSCCIFEIALKHKKGQLQLGPFSSPSDFWRTAIDHYRLEVLPTEALDFAAAVALPDHHKDPFDRIIIAQAKRISSCIVTYDKLFNPYRVPCIC